MPSCNTYRLIWVSLTLGVGYLLPAAAPDLRHGVTPLIAAPGLGHGLLLPATAPIYWRREWQSTPVFLPGELHVQRSLAGYSPWVCKDLHKTEQLTRVYIQERSRACLGDEKKYPGRMVGKLFIEK